MLQWIVIFVVAAIAGIIFRKVFVAIITLIIGIVAYLAFTNPEVASELFTKIKEIFGFVEQK